MNDQYDVKVNWSSGVHLLLRGYSIASRNLMYSLDAQNVKVKYQYIYGQGTLISGHEDASLDDDKISVFRNTPYNSYFPEVVFGLADVFHKNASRYKIGYTMFETDKIPMHWVEACNRMNEIWVPSMFNVGTFRSSGVHVPLHVIPLGVDPTFFYPGQPDSRYSPKFTFLSVFQWSERKNPQLLIKGFLEAFSDKEDVVLVLKTIGYGRGQNIHSEIQKMGYPNWQSKILIDDRELPDHLMGQVYRSADCFVFPTSGEGWGMPILEAMACGLPTIATNWSAPTEFLNEETGYPIHVKRLIPASEKVFALYRGLHYAEPDYENFVSLMRYVYENQRAVKERGQEVANKIVSKWTWDHAAQKIRERLTKIS